MAKFAKYGMLCVLVMVLVAGCATGAKKKSDEQLVTEQMQIVKKALESKDIDTLFTLVSDDF